MSHDPNNGRGDRQRVALVCTLVNARKVLKSFISYHLGMGIDRIYLFFDRVDDPGIEIAAAYPQVTWWARDADLERRWTGCRLYQCEPLIRDYVNQEVMARQQLNAELAIQECRQAGIDWILHLDVDECFFLPDESLQAHFSRLAAMGVDSIIYPNREGVPERAEVGDYFREVTLFKVKPSGNSPQQRQAIQDSRKLLGGRWYHFYENGKSAGRVGPDLLPHGVHGFATYRHSQRRSVRLWNRIGFYKLREVKREILNFLSIKSRRQRVAVGQGVVLHYPCCGFQHFWDKYVILGEFADTWFGKTQISHTVAMHVAARDVVNRQGRAAALAFFHQYFVHDDPEEVAVLEDCGLLARITGPSQQLAAAETMESSKPSPMHL